MGKISKYKKMQISRYGFPRKVRYVRPGIGRPKEMKVRKVEVFEEFCRWASLPTPLKDVKTMKAFSEKWGIKADTAAKWKHLPEFWKKVGEYRMEWAKDKTSDVVQGLFKRASVRGEAAEVKLWMELIEDWSEKAPAVTPNITVIGIQGITEEQLRKLSEPPEHLREEPVVDAEIVVEEPKT